MFLYSHDFVIVPQGGGSVYLVQDRDIETHSSQYSGVSRDRRLHEAALWFAAFKLQKEFPVCQAANNRKLNQWLLCILSHSMLSTGREERHVHTTVHTPPLLFIEGTDLPSMY